jgi:hypothetical protein
MAVFTNVCAAKLLNPPILSVRLTRYEPASSRSGGVCAQCGPSRLVPGCRRPPESCRRRSCPYGAGRDSQTRRWRTAEEMWRRGWSWGVYRSAEVGAQGGMSRAFVIASASTRKAVAKSSPSAIAGTKAVGADPPVGPLPDDAASNTSSITQRVHFAITLPPLALSLALPPLRRVRRACRG